MTLATVIDTIRSVVGEYRDTVNAQQQTIADLRKLSASKDVTIATLQAQVARTQPDINAALAAKTQALAAQAAAEQTAAAEKAELDDLHASADQLQAYLTAVPKPVAEDNYGGQGPHTPLPTPDAGNDNTTPAGSPATPSVDPSASASPVTPAEATPETPADTAPPAAAVPTPVTPIVPASTPSVDAPSTSPAVDLAGAPVPIAGTEAEDAAHTDATTVTTPVNATPVEGDDHNPVSEESPTEAVTSSPSFSSTPTSADVAAQVDANAQADAQANAQVEGAHTDEIPVQSKEDLADKASK